MENPTVNIEQGKLCGKTLKDIKGNPFFAFHGIPYAKPPVGPLRFKAPEPAEKWEGTLDATEQRDVCCQQFTSFSGPSELSPPPVTMGSEDCLFVNIFTHNIPSSFSSSAELKPVMVSIHGGGFVSCSGDVELNGPNIIMSSSNDVVFVTLNFRLGALGFLASKDPELDFPGNAGLKDIVEALKWIQKNIKHFGGDPKNVTIFGCSTGGVAVHYLVLSPLASGLFHKAIAQSGCALFDWTRGENSAKRLAEALGWRGNDEKSAFAFLQEQPVEKIIEGQLKIGDNYNTIDAVRPFSPSVEYKHPKALICEEPLQIIKSRKFNKVPFMIGYCSHEGMLYEMMKLMMGKVNTKQFVPAMLGLEKNTPFYSEINNKIINFFFGADTPDESNIEAIYNVFTDNFFFREINTTAVEHAKASPFPVFYYRISIDTDLNFNKKLINIKHPGTSHGDEVSYICSTFLTTEIKEGTPEDIGSRRFVQMWTDFAKTGNPTPEVNSLITTTWKSIEPNGELNYLEIGEDLKAGTNPDGERIQFWDDIFRSVKTERDNSLFKMRNNFK